jgi:FkbM family methyltransferase
MGLPRRFAERLTRNWVLRRRLPSTLGRGVIYVTPGAGGLRFLKPSLRDADPVLFALVEEFVSASMTVWDVGANVGIFAFSSARRAGPNGFVLAVEPDLETVALLLESRRRMDRLRCARVEVLSAAVLDGRHRFLELSIAARARSSNALAGYGTTQMGGIRETRIVPAFTLDELLEVGPPPDLVKIDIEAAEAEAISAANRLLHDVRPTLIVEVSGQNAKRVGDLLREADYRVFDAEVPRGLRRTHHAIVEYPRHSSRTELTGLASAVSTERYAGGTGSQSLPLAASPPGHPEGRPSTRSRGVYKLFANTARRGNGCSGPNGRSWREWTWRGPGSCYTSAREL